MDWPRLLAYITGTVDQELLLRNEYLAAENRILRALLVQSAHYILGRFGPDSALRRWGLKLAATGGKRGKKRAIVAVARKLAVILHRIWRSGESFQPFPLAAPTIDANTN